ncbi:UNVERIFIED_CONTAM: hypothetical protein Scaly_2627100 [Sesamum calycinum]|uniref:Uncharacterized protein n=1 Tax=Sesamum calycinum TaxID=2727403 RepID=A0AAW2JAY5_9LAMI
MTLYRSGQIRFELEFSVHERVNISSGLAPEREKTSFYERSEEERNLATYLIASVKEDRLFQIIEPRILTEGSLEQIAAVAELVKGCLKLNGEERPTMKDVAMEFKRLRKYNLHSDQLEENSEVNMAFTTDQQLGLYPVPANPDFSPGECSGQYSLDTQFLLAISSPH